MVHLADLFSVPEMGLLCNVAEYFNKNHIDYHPEILFLDVKVLFDCIFIYLSVCIREPYQWKDIKFFVNSYFVVIAITI